MRSAILSVIAALIAGLCVFGAISCSGDDLPRPEYVPVSLDDFFEQEFFDLDNYSEAAGFATELGFLNKANSEKFSLDMIADLADKRDVKISAFLITNKYVTSGSSGSNEGDKGSASGPVSSAAYQKYVKTEYGVYIYGNTLYADKTVDGVTQKDKIAGFENDISSLLEIADDERFFGDYILDMAEIRETATLFENYTEITYCEELKHYIYKIDYFDADGDDFTLDLQLFVDGGRIVKAELFFDDINYTAEISFVERDGSIEYPDDVNTYDGTFLDEAEEIYMFRDTRESDFFGTWVGENEGYTYCFEIDGDSVKLFSGYGDDRTEISFDGYETFVIYMALVNEYGDYSLKLNPTNGTMEFTLPDGTTMTLSKIEKGTSNEKNLEVNINE